MGFRRLLQIAAATATLSAPLAAVAATVTTAPLGQPVPTLAIPALATLAVALIGLGIYRIGARSGGVLTSFALLVGLSMLAGLSYAAVPTVSVEDGECFHRTTQPYSSDGSILRSLCSNPIEIVDIDKSCNGGLAGDTTGEDLPTCTIGQILEPNEICFLQGCV